MSGALRILHLEDDPDDAKLIERVLISGGLVVDCTRVETPEAFQAVLRQEDIDLIIADYQLPKFDGLSALGMARRECPDVPFLFVSGTIGEESAIAALKHGATDYLLKDRMASLPSAVCRALVESAERNERQRVEDQLYLLLSVTRAISEADGLDGALTVALSRICEATGWVFGEVWVPREAGDVLECSQAWHTSLPELSTFRAVSETMVFGLNQDLPGRAWAERKPVWVTDVTEDPRCLRTGLVRDAGLKSGVGIPVLADRHVVAVMEFFDTKKWRDEHRFVRLISGVAAQIGAVILRKRAEDRVKASLRMKDALLREIHHRVKNNMQVISSLLSLQSSRITHLSTRLLFRESQSRIRAMALVHERLCGSNDLVRVDFSEYLRTLTVNLFRVYEVDRRRVTLEVDADRVFLSLDVAVPCGLIVNELVSNALKHAFPDARQGVVRVTMSQGNGERDEIDSTGCTLVIQDTGVGIPDTLDLQQTPTLGLQLVPTLVDQLGGRLIFDRSGGTTATIRFQDHVPA